MTQQTQDPKTSPAAHVPPKGAVVEKKKSAQQNLKELLEKAKPQLAAVLPRHVTAERMIKVALSCTARTPALLECSAMSIVRSVMQGAELGLEAGGLLGEGYLVPFFNKHTKQKEAQFIPGYRGLVKLARQSGEVASVEARAVFEGDFFEYEYGFEQKLKHVPAEENPGRVLRFVYVIFRFKEAHWAPYFDVMSRDEVEAVRKRSQASSGPWDTDYAEMAKKTVVRRGSKMFPLATERAAAFNRAIEIGDLADAGLTTDIEVTGEEVVDPEDTPQLTRGEKLTETLGDKLRAGEKQAEPVEVPRG